LATSAQQIRAWRGSAVFRYGFRPFFLGAAAFAAGAMVIWIWSLAAGWVIPSAYSPVDWHAHEFLWGYLYAVAAGFLLTAIPNWTGRLPVVGMPLAVLWILWLSGRLAMFFSIYMPPVLSAAIDLLFPLAFAFVVAREINAGKNWRNLKVLAAFSLLTAGNVIFHFQAIMNGTAASGLGVRIGVAAGILLIIIIGGRIVPSFTGNWLAKRESGRMPSSFGVTDQVALVITGAALATWVTFPASVPTGILGILAGAMNLVRLARWAGWRTLAEPLVAILHIGYLFVPVGFFLTAAAALWPETVPMATAQHAWMAGAFSIMTIAVMTRTSLGHSGMPLKADMKISMIYVLLISASVLRIIYGFSPATFILVEIAGLCWILGFAGFVLVYTPIMFRKK
jgi:uncharacterized protein involved in response to NO